MYRAIAKKIVGEKPATMEYPMYRQAVRCVENTLRRWTRNLVTAIISITLVVGMAAMLVTALVTPEPGYYKPNENGVLVDGMPYHYHIEEGCDICD